MLASSWGFSWGAADSNCVPGFRQQSHTFLLHNSGTPCWAQLAHRQALDVAQPISSLTCQRMTDPCASCFLCPGHYFCRVQIFGATDEDVDKLRIVSLYEMDLDKMESLVNGSDAAPAAAAEPAADQQQGSSGSSSSSGTEEKK